MLSIIRQVVTILALSLVLLVVQGIIENTFNEYNAIIPLAILPAVICTSFIFEPRLAAFTCFLIGLCYDLYSSSLIGPGSGALLATSAIINLLIDSIILDSILNQAILGLIAAFCALFIKSLLSYQNTGFNIDFTIFSQSIASAIFCPIAISLLIKVSPYIGLRYGKSSYF